MFWGIANVLQCNGSGHRIHELGVRCEQEPEPNLVKMDKLLLCRKRRTRVFSIHFYKHTLTDHSGYRTSPLKLQMYYEYDT